MSDPRVLLVTSDREHCGVREYGRLLIEHSPPDTITEFPHTHPDSLFAFLDCPKKFDVIHLNHHAALHSRWNPAHIEKLHELKYGTVVTLHDTFQTYALMQERGLPFFPNADQRAVHELIPDAPVHSYMLHQPVPLRPGLSPRVETLGLFGFDFPWKGFDDAIRAAARTGWSVRLICPNITIERSEALQALYPRGGLEVLVGWRRTEEIVDLLSECWATAFLYSCGNSGTSGAIRYGIAAGRPVLAYPCRQFEDLKDNGVREYGISWVDNQAAVEKELNRLTWFYDYWKARQLVLQQVALRDSWTTAGNVYHHIYTEAARAAMERGA